MIGEYVSNMNNHSHTSRTSSIVYKLVLSHGSIGVIAVLPVGRNRRCVPVFGTA